jgi:hypothetical protein
LPPYRASGRCRQVQPRGLTPQAGEWETGSRCDRRSACTGLQQRIHVSPMRAQADLRQCLRQWFTPGWRVRLPDAFAIRLAILAVAGWTRRPGRKKTSETRRRGRGIVNQRTSLVTASLRRSLFPPRTGAPIVPDTRRELRPRLDDPGDVGGDVVESSDECSSTF